LSNISSRGSKKAEPKKHSAWVVLPIVAFLGLGLAGLAPVGSFLQIGFIHQGYQAIAFAAVPENSTTSSNVSNAFSGIPIDGGTAIALLQTVFSALMLVRWW
jgi:hypothetical protein